MMRKKPVFLRRDWHKRTRFMRKKKMKWRNVRGMDNKIRLGFKGYARRVKVGWGSKKKNGPLSIRVENLTELQKIKNHPIVIGKVGKKKREEIIKKAAEMKLTILNKYYAKTRAGEQNATK
jgi:ribosomal protein L32E